MIIKRVILLVGLLSIAWPVGRMLWAGEEEPAPQFDLTTDQIPGLGSVRSERVYTTIDSLAERKVPPEQADILREYGFVRLADRRYTSRAGEIAVEIYTMRDFKAAFGLYTYLKMPGGKTIRVGDASSGTPNEIVFWQSNYCIHIKSQNAAANPTMQKIAHTLAQRIPQHSSVPALVTYLPESGLQSKSVRYFLGQEGLRRHLNFAEAEALGLKDQVEALVADYALDRHKGKVILLGYPNHPLSIHYHRALESALEARKSETSVYTKRAGVIVAILLGDFGSATAHKLLDEITYTDSVQWIYDKRSFMSRASANYNALPIIRTVVNSIAFTGLLGLTSLSAGIIVGGLRFLYTRRWADRSIGESTALIHLNLSGR